jgi:hypothetical protein
VSKARPGIGGKLIASFILGVFVLGGGALTGLFLHGTWSQRAAADWPTVSGRILDSEAVFDDEQDAYAAVIRYRYQVAGTFYERDDPYREGRGVRSGDNFGPANDLVMRFQPGDEVRVHVNPADPADAALAWPAASDYVGGMLAAIFPLIGAVGLWSVWASPIRKDGPLRPAWDRLGRRRQAGLAATLFFGVFLAVGGGIFMTQFVPAWLALQASQDWPAVEATVVDADLRSESTDDGTVYRADVRYRYTVDGRTYRSNRHDFFGVSSSNRDHHRGIVRDHPPGSTVTVYVDPDDPTEAVISRQADGQWLWALIPLAFAIIGGMGTGAGLWFTLVPEATRHVAKLEPHGVGGAATMTLDPRRGLQIGTALAFALCWNCIAWPLALIFTADGILEEGWWLVALVWLFPLIGLILALTAIRIIIGAATRAEPTLTIDPAFPRAGRPLRVDWAFPIKRERPESLRLRLERGEERLRIATIPKRDLTVGSTDLDLPHDAQGEWTLHATGKTDQGFRIAGSATLRIS